MVWYGEFDDLTAIIHNGFEYTYTYDNDGNVAKKTDAIAGVTTKYDYNDAGLLVQSEVYAGFKLYQLEL